MFRASERNEIANLINKTATFDFSDFTIVEDKNHVQIKYLYSEKNFFFSFNIPEKETSTKNNYGEETFIFKFFGNMNPGRISTLESYTANSIYELHDKIKLWIKELEVELLNIQVHRKFVKTEEKMNEIVTKINDITEGIEDSFFSKIEANDLKEQLDLFQNSIIEKLEDVIKNKKELENEVNILKTEIEKLKKSTESISRKNWLKKYMSKCIEWSLNPEKRNLILGAIKIIGGATKLMGIEGHIDKDIIDLFPDSIQEVIPENLVQSDEKLKI